MKGIKALIFSIICLTHAEEGIIFGIQIMQNWRVGSCSFPRIIIIGDVMWRRISSSALALWIVKVWHLFREEELVETSTNVRLIKSIISRFSIRKNFLSKKLGYALQLPIMEGSFELHQLLTSTTSPFPQVYNLSILMRG